MMNFDSDIIKDWDAVKTSTKPPSTDPAFNAGTTLQSRSFKAFVKLITERLQVDARTGHHASDEISQQAYFLYRNLASDLLSTHVKRNSIPANRLWTAYLQAHSANVRSETNTFFELMTATSQLSSISRPELSERFISEARDARIEEVAETLYSAIPEVSLLFSHSEQNTLRFWVFTTEETFKPKLLHRLVEQEDELADVFPEREVYVRCIPLVLCPDPSTVVDRNANLLFKRQ